MKCTQLSNISKCTKEILENGKAVWKNKNDFNIVITMATYYVGKKLMMQIQTKI